MLLSLECQLRLGERQHRADGVQIGIMNGRGATQMAFVLGGFLGKNVALERLTAFDGTARTHHEALCSTLLGLHLRHNYSNLLDGHGCAADPSVLAKTP